MAPDLCSQFRGEVLDLGSMIGLATFKSQRNQGNVLLGTDSFLFGFDTGSEVKFGPFVFLSRAPVLGWAR